MKVYSSGIDNQDLLGYNDNRKVVDDMSLSIRLTRKERRLAESYAKLHSSTVEDAFKKALFETMPPLPKKRTVSMFRAVRNQLQLLSYGKSLTYELQC